MVGATQILAELFHATSTARKAFITPGYEKKTQNLLNESVTGEWLFGDKLGERVKDLKAVESVALELKPQDEEKKNQQSTPDVTNFINSETTELHNAINRLEDIGAIEKSYVNKMGGIRFPHLNKITKELWDWCESRKIWVFAEYIPSKENTEADTESRITNLDTEWELNDKNYKTIVDKFGKPEIDLFATRCNKKCNKFCSWQRDPEALVINAFTMNWEKYFWYAFPPFALIPRIMKKIREEGSSGVIVENTTSNGLEPFTDCRDIITRSFKLKGSSDEVAKVLLASLADSTIKQYQSALKVWWSYCQERRYNPYQAEARVVLEFLADRLKAGASYGTLNTLRAAISLISKESLSECAMLNRFFKRVFRIKPIRPKYNSFRVQSLALIKLSCIKFKSSTVEIKIEDITKTSRPGTFNPFLEFPWFKEKPGLCVALTLQEYINVTETIRKNKSGQLFLSYVKPHGEASSQTLSRWIKEILVECGIDDKYTAHSTRHASTSFAFKKGLDYDTIRNSAGWSKDSSVFARFYNRPITVNNNNFAKTVILDQI
ncbi:uncharacterized protein LOC122850548 [Aphidius gifuensis]|uniref:uncharacterized protein LOC122850548 n=1 Tax=Aphidius gifuensis TaxID=684658 RepID=UPI001CDCF459|nr:uncharacterized protein LOC122850548 [Aphidius gifuensis]